MKMNKTILAIVGLILVAALLLGVYFLMKPETSEGSKTFTVQVIHGDGSSKEFTYTTEEEYVGAVLQAEGLIEGVAGPYGLEIHAVDGETASWEENQSYWAIYLGEERSYAETGIDLTPVHDGDLFILEYTIG